MDYNLAACLTHNPQKDIVPETILEVLAVWEGENDGDSWRWILRLVDGSFAFVRGGCDYTGWDCQSWAESNIVDTLDQLVSVLDESEKVPTCNDSLKAQLVAGKKETWREKMDREFGLKSI